ncbi:hypothetical protein PR048_005427 [Dryococelus australis]|uniref:PiggyBac transposable element-derived protein domain-containing protein n=1 Tax=Dryococelus australis TaxID=614101 RepID=A0ABQ9I8A9_9NEOP|nr:hypothetical protein PR048_005427 [Dryococelus australis]
MGNPIMYGYKLLVGATNKGYAAWMETYQGMKIKINDKYKRIYRHTLALCNFPYHVLFDNNFTTVPLLKELAKRRLKISGIIRQNRITHDQSVVICKWNDINVVFVESNAASVEPLHDVSRFSQK